MAISAKRKAAANQEPRKMKIKKGDTVRVIAGKSKGHEGEVIGVQPKKGRVTVHQANVIKKATRPHPQKNPQGGIIEQPAPLDVSNVALICPRCSKATKVVFKKDSEGKTSRKCRKCGEMIDG
jgi:large subunit ribosomal protein L24